MHVTRPVLQFGLAGLVRALAKKALASPIVESVSSTPWSSITFTGMRHCIALRFIGPDASDVAARLADGLDYTEFDLGRYILVDVAITDTNLSDDGARLTLEALILIGD